jgi:hypothetical protein
MDQIVVIVNAKAGLGYCGGWRPRWPRSLQRMA